MADLFVPYSHTDRQPVSALAHALHADGYEVCWDNHLRAYEDFGVGLEESLRRSNCAIVAWSPS
jgi:hypothetical protein